MFDVEKVRLDFPILKRKIHSKTLVYFDNAATSQKPEAVIESMSHYYRDSNANVHRGVHTLSQEATTAYEAVRKQTADFINAQKEEIIFVRNTTEAINLVAHTWGDKNIKKGDEILLTEMEHHSNIIPWQILSKKTGANLKYIPINQNGELELKNLSSLVSKKTKLLGLVHASNVLGTINPVKEIIRQVKSLPAGRQVKILVDGAQAAPHFKVSVSSLGADFYAFSAHKMLGPTGVGVLWGKKEILEKLPPFLGGGEMNLEVYKNAYLPNALPWKFEAGTPDIAAVVGFGAALSYLEKLDLKEIRNFEKDLLEYALAKLSKIVGLEIYGPQDPSKQLGVTSFNLKGVHAHDLASVLDEEGIAVRSGVQCAMPLHQALGIKASARASFYLYNTREEIDRFSNALGKAKKIFRV